AGAGVAFGRSVAAAGLAVRGGRQAQEREEDEERTGHGWGREDGWDQRRARPPRVAVPPFTPRSSAAPPRARSPAPPPRGRPSAWRGSRAGPRTAPRRPGATSPAGPPSAAAAPRGPPAAQWR